MKKLTAFLLSMIALLTLVSCGKSSQTGTTSEPSGTSNQMPSAGNQESNQDTAVSAADTSTGQESKTLIVYFSVPEDVNTNGVDAIAGASVVVSDGEVLGNTEYVARIIQQTVGGNLFRIETEDTYPLDHDPLVDQAAQEQEDAVRPQLASQIENPDQYDTILLGYPNWWADMPMPLYSFLEEYDFSGKTIIPFITHGGSRASQTITTISKLQPNASVNSNALVLSRNDVAKSGADVIAWASGLGI